MDNNSWKDERKTEADFRRVAASGGNIRCDVDQVQLTEPEDVHVARGFILCTHHHDLLLEGSTGGLVCV